MINLITQPNYGKSTNKIMVEIHQIIHRVEIHQSLNAGESHPRLFEIQHFLNVLALK